MTAYKVLVTEVLQKTVIVDAKSEQEAQTRVEDAWSNTEFILEPEDFQGVEFYVVGKAGADENFERIDSIDGECV